MIRVLVVEDSPSVRKFLIHVLGSDPEVSVAGAAADGEEALEAVERLKPDVVTMDIHMPKVNGFDATRRIMENAPVPIVIVSGSTTRQELATTFHALEAGAVAVVMRPEGIGNPRHEETAKEFLRTVKLMSEIKVVRRWAQPPRSWSVKTAGPNVFFKTSHKTVRLVAIGSSTGGPLVLQNIFLGLEGSLSVPVLIVQHMAPGFIYGFTEWLSQSTGFPVQVAVDGQPVLPGHAYVAPDGLQMGIKNGGQIVLTESPAENGLKPSVSYLFRSARESFGAGVAGILLTGMGKDGAWELKEMKDAGAVTIAQDKESSVVYGMPGEAVRLEAASAVLSPEKIINFLKSLGENNESGQGGRNS
jgi:two-component system chemotaxis response regulator CheB